MATTRLPADFRKFLKLLNSHEVEYLLVGSYAVGYHGYPRLTGDLPIWVGMDPQNATRLARSFEEFGFRVPELSPDLFFRPNQHVRMGVPPLRIDILTTISGVEFPECYARRMRKHVEGIEISLIGLQDLKTNKKGSGRHRDLDHFENLP